MSSAVRVPWGHGATPRRHGLALWLMAVMVLSTTAAWACVPQPLVFVQPHASGSAGSRATVEGVSFGKGPVEIRWNKLDGQTLASGVGPTLSQPIIIPDAPAGLYTLIVIERDSNGGIAASARAAFQVTGDSDAQVTPGADDDEDQAVRPASSSGGLNAGVALAGAAALLVAGGFAGAWLRGRRRDRRALPPPQRAE